MASTPLPEVGARKPSVSSDKQLQQQALPNNPEFMGRRIVTAVNRPVKHADYPRLMYHPTEPRWSAANNEAEYAAAKEKGWLEEPLVMHREMLQGNGKARVATTGSESEAAKEEPQQKKKVK